MRRSVQQPSVSTNDMPIVKLEEDPNEQPVVIPDAVIPKRQKRRRKADKVKDNQHHETPDLQVISVGVEVATQTWTDSEDERNFERIDALRQKLTCPYIKAEDFEEDQEM